jgi:hypothetical protein
MEPAEMAAAVPRRHRLLIPALDVAYALVWLPGLALAVTGRILMSRSP